MFVAVTEEKFDAVGIRTVGLFQQIAVRLLLLKGQHNDIIRVEMGIGYPQNIVDVQGVTPDSILTDIRSCRGLIGLVREGYHLTLLREFEVTIGILQGIDAVFAWGNALDDEMTRSIST